MNLDQNLIDRMVQHFRNVEKTIVFKDKTDGLGKEALEIAKLLPPPPDPDVEKAQEILNTQYYLNDPDWAENLHLTRIVKAIKWGRQNP